MKTTVRIWAAQLHGDCEHSGSWAVFVSDRDQRLGEWHFSGDDPQARACALRDWMCADPEHARQAIEMWWTHYAGAWEWDDLDAPGTDVPGVELEPYAL